ncbi:aminoglycoside phosphotransferase [Camelimonas fluminis]|uniref:Phosphotransferase family protein n=1 Tax=Camelimonas fluminis TaxID=1576911 RepID=A0ABV7UC83_9HYPH|nr:phosphotransferase family protein [Camelimonas fluminis]GHE48258.1 aminoglycoside phosphotransferase [Camelimonas fluminis]
MAGQVREPDALDGEAGRDALRNFLEGYFGERPERFEVDKISGGQSNPTYFIDFGDRRMVLRKQPPGKLLPGAHAIDREFRALEALNPVDVPTPRAVLHYRERDVLGTPFYLMDRLDGRVFHDCALPGIAPEERRAIYLGLAEAMAKLHAVQPEKIGLGDFGKPGNYFQRQIARWTRAYNESPSERIPALDRLVEWLPANMPEDDGRVAIAHGDFRLGNMLYHPTEPRVTGILDWELSTLGHPLADLAFACIPWRTTPDQYGGISGLDHAALGIPTEAEFIAHYYEHAVPTAKLLPFHVAFALFRFSVIFLGINDRVRAGNAAGDDAAKLEPLAREMADRAVEAIG